MHVSIFSSEEYSQYSLCNARMLSTQKDAKIQHFSSYMLLPLGLTKSLAHFLCIRHLLEVHQKI